MRVLVLSDLWVPFPGGAERLIFNLARTLHQHDGLDVSVLTGYEHAFEFDGPPVTVLPIGTGALRDEGAAMLTGFLAAARFDVIVTHHYYASQFEREIIASGVPFAQIVLNGRRIPEAGFAVYISQWVRNGLRDDRVGDMVMTPPVFDDVRAETHAARVGFVKPIEHKGIGLLYEIAAAMPEREFVVLRGEWQDIEIIKPMPNVTFIEPVVDMRDFYCLVDRVLVPSTSEDAGTVAQECTVNGIPCISTDVCGLAETNAGGLLLSTRDVAAWVTAIEALDDVAVYDAVVRRMAEHLASTRQDEQLARFVENVAALAR